METNRKWGPPAIRYTVLALLSMLTASVFCCLLSCGDGRLLAADRSILDFLLSGKPGVRIGLMTGCILSFWVFDRFAKRIRRFSVLHLLLAAFCTLFFIIGYTVSATGSPAFLFPVLSGRMKLLLFGDLLLLFYAAIALVDAAMDDYRSKHLSSAAQAPETDGKRTFLLYAAILLAARIPDILINFPGSVMEDTQHQLDQFLGADPLSNHNPILDTVIFGSVFSAGRFLTGVDNGGVFACVLMQSVLYACSFAYCIRTVYHVTGSKTAERILLILFSVNVAFGGAVTMVQKDSLHISLIVFYLCFLIRVIHAGTLDKRGIAVFSVLFLLGALSRKAASAYVITAGLLTVFLLRKESRKRFLLSAVACIAAFLCVENVLYPALGAESAPNRELFSLPLQSIAYTTKQNYASMTEAELAEINEVLPVDGILKDYSQDCSDPMKALVPRNLTREQMTKLLKLSASLAVRYPKDAVSSVLVCCYKYYYPLSTGVNFYSRTLRKAKGSEHPAYYVFPQLKKVQDDVLAAMGTLPFYRVILGPGIYTWLLFFCVIRMVRTRSRRLLPVLLSLCVLAVGFVFTPLNGGNRYAYPLYVMAPAAAVILLFEPKSEESL